MSDQEKKVNKWLVNFVIGGTVLGVTGLTGKTNHKRGLLQRFFFWIYTLRTKFRGSAEQVGEKIGKTV